MSKGVTTGCHPSGLFPDCLEHPHQAKVLECPGNAYVIVSVEVAVDRTTVRGARPTTEGAGVRYFNTRTLERARLLRHVMTF